MINQEIRYRLRETSFLIPFLLQPLSIKQVQFVKLQLKHFVTLVLKHSISYRTFESEKLHEIHQSQQGQSPYFIPYHPTASVSLRTIWQYRIYSA